MTEIELAEKALQDLRDAQAKKDAAAAASTPVLATEEQIKAALRGFVAEATAQEGRATFTATLRDASDSLTQEVKDEFLVDSIMTILEKHDLKTYVVDGRVVLPLTATPKRLEKQSAKVLEAFPFKNGKGHVVTLQYKGKPYTVNVQDLLHTPAVGTEVLFNFRINKPGSVSLWRVDGKGLVGPEGDYAHASVKYFGKTTADCTCSAKSFPAPKPSGSAKKGATTP